MAAADETVLFDVHDFTVYPLTDDSGDTPTYGDAVDVYGIADVGLDPTLISAELKGDGKVIAKKGKVDRLKVTGTYGRLSSAVLAVIMAAASSDPSATVHRTRIKAGQNLPYFGASFVIEDADNGIAAVRCRLYKCQLTGGTLLNQQTDQFGQPKLELECIGLSCLNEDGTESDFTDVMADIDFSTESFGEPTMVDAPPPGP